VRSIVVAFAENRGIGYRGQLPWRLPSDLRRFRELTTGHVVVVGRLTHESIVRRLGHPLPNRLTVVVTSRRDLPDVVCQPDLPGALTAARAIEAFAGGDEVFVIGGAQVYAAAQPYLERVHLTRVHAVKVGDVRLPPDWLDPFTLVAAEKNDDDPLPVTRCEYRR
jgi:dihydrofolate reductase